MSTRSARSYRRTFLETASPPKILVELLLRLERDLEDARASIVARDPGGKGVALGHAIEILGFLRGALDHAAAPDLCANLARVYDFIERRVMDANLRMDPVAVVEATRALAPIREAFVVAVAQVAGGPEVAPVGGAR